jgi:hypothetical protein
MNETEIPTPRTDAIETNIGSESCRSRWIVDSDFARQLERENAAMREQIKNSAINTNVRLFDLVRYMRSELHEAELITDEEYAWLCGGCEMANSTKGGSPSPRRLEDYDAMREAIKEARRVIENARFVHQAITTYAPQDAVDKVENQKHCDGMTACLEMLKPYLP